MDKINTYSLDKHREIFSLPQDDQDFLFMETTDHPTIAEPYRADSYAIGFLRNGSVIMQTGLRKEKVSAPAMITIGPSVIRSFHKTKEGIEMDVVIFQPLFFLESQANIFFLEHYSFFRNSALHAIHLNREQAAVFQGIFKLIKDTLRRKSPHYSSVIRTYIYALIYELDDLRDANMIDEKPPHPLVERFRNLLSQEFRHHRNVSFYAGYLNVTRKYLSEVVKKSTGKTAGAWIDEVVLMEAKVLLHNKALSINQISAHLNFSNQSVFGKFFKTGTGCAPIDYRKQQSPRP